MKRLMEVVKMYYKKVTVKKIIALKSPMRVPEGLGRWNVDYCNKKLNRKIDLANEDHCGPCGQYKLEK